MNIKENAINSGKYGLKMGLIYAATLFTVTTAVDLLFREKGECQGDAPVETPAAA